MVAEPRRGDVFLIDLDPTRGGEIRKTRPCVIVSPDELTVHVRTVIVAPWTTRSHSYPYRIACRSSGKSGHVVADQVRTVHRERLVRRLGPEPPICIFEDDMGRFDDGCVLGP